MAHPEEGAAEDITLPEGDLTVDDAAEAIEAIDLEALEQEELEPAPQEDEGATEEEEITAEEDEPEQPAIEPPASWNADDKERFQALPREAQDIIVRREAERDTGFQKKSEEFATDRKRYQEQVQKEEAHRQFLENQVAQLAQMVLPEKPDPSMLQQDPVAYLEAEARYKAGIEQLNGMRQQYQAQAQQRGQQSQEEYAKWMQDQKTILAEKLPEYSGENSQEFKKSLADYGRAQGYEPERLSGADASDLVILNKAMLYDKLQESKPTKLDAVKDLPKVQKSSARIGKKAASMDRMSAARNKLAKTGSLDDAAAAIGLIDIG